MTELSQCTEVDRRRILAEYVERTRKARLHTLSFEPTQRERSVADAMVATTFGAQRKFFFDSNARRRCGFCTRRAGKTEGGTIMLLSRLLLEPNCVQLYTARTSKVARAVLWPKLQEYIARYGLAVEQGGCLNTNETFLWVKHTRGNGMIILLGADKADEVDKFRGLKLRTVILDEAATYGVFFESLVVEALGPALRDLGGDLLMIGTAGRRKEGLFYEACHGLRKRRSDGQPVYELHGWSLVDNPYLPDSAKDLDAIIDEEGFSGPDDPRFLREYMRIWAIGDTERMFAYNSDVNDYSGPLPEGHNWNYLLGCDFGWSDETAISVIAWSPTHKAIYIPETWSKRHAYTDEVASKMFDLRQKYGARRMVGDTGGYGKAVAVQLLRDYGIHIEAANKREKLSFLEFFNSALRRADLRVQKGDKLCKQFLTVAWNEDRTDAGKHERDDLCFSAVYGWRAAKFAGAGKRTPSERRGEADTATTYALREKQAALKEQQDDEDAWFYGGRDLDADEPGLGVGRQLLAP